MSNNVVENIKELISIGLTPEQAYNAAMGSIVKQSAASGKSAKSAAKKKTEKPAKSAKHEAKPAATGKLSAKEAGRAIARESAEALDGVALITGAKWNIEEGVNTKTGGKVWSVSPQERFGLAEFYAVRAAFSEILDAGYYRGAWGVRFDPSSFLETGKLTPEQERFVADAKEKRKAEREKKKKEKSA